MEGSQGKKKGREKFPLPDKGSLRFIRAEGTVSPRLAQRGGERLPASGKPEGEGLTLIDLPPDV